MPRMLISARMARMVSRDKPETVLSRLKVYHDQTAPLVDFYEKKGLLHRIDGAKDRDAIYADILNVLGAKA